MKTFYKYELDGKKIAFHKDDIIFVQVGKGKGSYKNRYSFSAQDFGKAVFYYNGINIGKGYKKRLICHELNKPILARQFSKIEKTPSKLNLDFKKALINRL
jgi:hypothetical protein